MEHEKDCKPDVACFPVNTPLDDGEYYIVCYSCKKKWKWKLDKKGLEEFKRKYDLK